MSKNGSTDTDFIEHYFYFPERFNADKAAERLQAKGWRVQVTKGADEENWLVFATQLSPIEDELEKLWWELTRLAKEFNGEYDGYGRPG
ncbi:MAG TPA: ribonuclease E inhibitor RraB [Terriglobales bacterium]|nr:ribonuclease E inhibitor RraB [Terriglobales bacterium]